MDHYEVLGYMFNADTYCIDCTFTYLKDKYKDEFNTMDKDKYEDCEGNPIHPICAGTELINDDEVCGNFHYHMETDGDICTIKEANYFDHSFLEEIVKANILEYVHDQEYANVYIHVNETFMRYFDNDLCQSYMANYLIALYDRFYFGGDINITGYYNAGNKQTILHITDQ